MRTLLKSVETSKYETKIAVPITEISYLVRLKIR